jgi:hypothetical protein
MLSCSKYLLIIGSQVRARCAHQIIHQNQIVKAVGEVFFSPRAQSYVSTVSTVDDDARAIDRADQAPGQQQLGWGGLPAPVGVGGVSSRLVRNAPAGRTTLA